MLRAVDSAIRPAEWVEIDETLQEQQLCKDADEIECLKLAIRANLAAYARAQQVIRPGISELEVLSQCQAAAQQAAGEPIYHNGDYRAGEFGGFARDRALQAGELYIIDAWSDVHGYWCDMARTWVVGGQPSPLQAEIYEHLAGVLRAVPELIRPGLCTRTFWTEIDRRLREHPEMREVGLTHHAGHGVGMRVHEGPDLNRDRGGFFAPGNVVTCEPGFYRDDLRRGIRLENVFLVTDTGAENLSDTPLSLVQQPQEPEFAVW
jgi:Xaa-Pro aminopeptidase